VQQGDPLGALLFSLVLMQFIDFVNLHDLDKLWPWYLDNGTLIGSRSSILELLNAFSSQFGLHPNVFKCKLFCPFGDTFPKFPANVKRVWNF